jgi:hypothetical protein
VSYTGQHLKYMKVALLLNQKPYLRFAMVLPALGFIVLTGCASIGGTAQDRQPTNTPLATYMEESQQTVQPVDSDLGPDYDWFY